jgi:hypothetical protein
MAPSIKPDSYYYHAGVRFDEYLATEWSDHTRRSWDAAVREAQRMARRYSDDVSVRPIVEYWDRAHGLRPGFVDAVAGADFVDKP